MARVTAMPPAALRALGAAGMAHVAARFSRGAFAAALEGHCRSLREVGRWPQRAWLRPVLWLAVAFVACALLAGGALLAALARLALPRARGCGRR